ncbi:MAG: helix-turn-helix domain-containing protein [Candidatus Thorarchaeota archaeon]
MRLIDKLFLWICKLFDLLDPKTRKAKPILEEKWKSLPHNKIIKQYISGESSSEIAEDYGCCSNTILKVLRHNGILIRQRGRRFNYEGSENMH